MSTENKTETRKVEINETTRNEMVKALETLYNFVAAAEMTAKGEPTALAPFAELLASSANYTGGKGSNPDLLDHKLFPRVTHALRCYDRANRGKVMASARKGVEDAIHAVRLERRQEIADWNDLPETTRKMFERRGFPAPNANVTIDVRDLLAHFPAGTVLTGAIGVLTGWGYDVAEGNDPTDKRKKVHFVSVPAFGPSKDETEENATDQAAQ